MNEIDNEINLGKNDNVSKNDFNKFFEETNEIVVQALEQSDDIEVDVEDDTVYELDLYNSLISGLSLVQQNNRKIQEKYLTMARNIINLKNKFKKVDLGDLEDYSDMEKIYKNEFNVSWILPIVLDKKKVYKKLDISEDDEMMDSYVNTTSNRGIKYEDFFEELGKEIQFIDEFRRDKLSFKTYRKLVYDIEQPYIIKKELKKHEIGYHLYLNQFTELLRYFNIDNKFWQKYIDNGPERYSYEVFDENKRYIGSKEAQLVSGAYTNIIGLMVLGSKEDNILDALVGEPWFDRIRKIGEGTKIERNKEAIVEMKNHGLKSGERVMILGSDSEPSIDGEYKVKVINENKFMVGVNTEEGKDGTKCEVYATTTLSFKKIELDKKILDEDSKEDYSGKFMENATLYLFPEVDINDEEWKQICKKVIPRAGAIIENQNKNLENCNTIEEMNDLLKRFSLEFKNLGWDEYFTLTEILDEKYLDEKKKLTNFNFDKYYGEIMALRSKIIGENKEDQVEDDIIFGNKYIFDKDIVKYYGNYPNAGTDVDSIASRYNWLYGTPDYGKFYFLKMELNKVKEFEELSLKDVEELGKKLKKQIEEIEEEIKGVKNSEKCEKRKIEPVKIYNSFNQLFEDRGKITDFNIGDYALIESNKAHEDGQIFVWNGINWTQNILVKSLDDLCLLGVEKIKDFDLEKLHCLFKKACKNKKQVRLEKKLEKLEEEYGIVNDLTKFTTKEIEKKLKEQIKIAELKLQIYEREIEDTRQKETIETYQQDYDPIYLEILQIADSDTKDYLRNLLIKKDGIIIDKDIYSIRTGKKICCGHYYYHMKIASGGSPEYSEKIVDEMLAIFGTEEENGMYFCNHDGRPLMMVDYDTAEGLSKTTGEIDKQREIVLNESEELREMVMDLQTEEREAEIFECSSSEIRNELLKTGFKVEQVVKAKEICGKINTLNGKTGIILKKREFIDIIIDVMQISQRKIPDFATFKKLEITEWKKKGINIEKINFTERYNNLVTVKKTSLIAARLLITYQTLVPPQYPTGKRSGVIFEGFQGDTGNEYMALLIDEVKMMPIVRKNKGVEYAQVGKVKDEIRRAGEELGDLSTVKKLRKDKKVYERKEIKEQEERVGVEAVKVEKVDKLGDKFMDQVENAKKYAEFVDFQTQLRGRQKYIAYEIIKNINDAISTAADKQRDDPKSIEMSCCAEEVKGDSNYFKYIAEKTNEGIYDLLEESIHNSYYSALFIKSGILMKHYPKRDVNFHLKVSNLGYYNDKVKKNLFLTYIDNGIFKGEKHDFVDGICLITGEKEQDILKRDYTDDEEIDLIKVIISKSVKKIVIGGTKEDMDILKKRDEELLGDLDLEKLRKESKDNLYKEINRFVEKMGNLLNRTSNKSFMNKLKEKIESLGILEDKIEAEMREAEKSKNPRKIINVENEKYRMRIFNLKRYINNYFRKYISMISNNHDPIERIREIEDMDDETSREMQRYIYDREYFIKKYLTKKDSEIFKKLNFDVSYGVIANINADTDKWNKDFSKIEKTVEFNLSHLSDVLLYVLIHNLEEFLSIDFGKGIDANKVVAQFILEILDRIDEDEGKLDYTYGVFIEGDYRVQDITEEERPRDEVSRMIGEMKSKFRKTDEDNYEEVYKELEKRDKVDTLRMKFIKEYKEKHDEEPNENLIMDYLDNMDKNEAADKEEDEEEYVFGVVNEEGEDVLEIGEGYGEMPQGREGGEEGDY